MRKVSVYKWKSNEYTTYFDVVWFSLQIHFIDCNSMRGLVTWRQWSLLAYDNEAGLYITHRDIQLQHMNILLFVYSLDMSIIAEIWTEIDNFI